MPTTQIDPTPTTETVTSPACPACPHALDAHDTIGARYCSATVAGGLDRRCVCSGGAHQQTHK